MGLLASGVALGCSRAPDERNASIHRAEPVRVVFPDSVRVEDETVNAFVRTTVDACLKGEYEPFRTLWSKRDEPFTREHFENGWRHAERITVHEIQPMRRPDDGALLYYVHAGIELSRSVRDPKREVVLLVVKEDGAWKLAKAPGALVKRVLNRDSDDAQS